MGKDITLSPLFVPLMATVVAALVAFITRRRIAFVTGALACWIIALMPRTRVRISWSREATFERMLLYDLKVQWQYNLDYIPIATVIGIILGLVISELLPNRFCTSLCAEREPFDMTQIPDK